MKLAASFFQAYMSATYFVIVFKFFLCCRMAFFFLFFDTILALSPCYLFKHSGHLNGHMVEWSLPSSDGDKLSAVRYVMNAHGPALQEDRTQQEQITSDMADMRMKVDRGTRDSQKDLICAISAIVYVPDKKVFSTYPACECLFFLFFSFFFCFLLLHIQTNTTFTFLYLSFKIYVYEIG